MAVSLLVLMPAKILHGSMRSLDLKGEFSQEATANPRLAETVLKVRLDFSVRVPG